MNSRLLTVALITDVFPEPEENDRLLARLRDARARGAQLAVLPELPLNRWAPATRTPSDADAEPPAGPRASALAAAARTVGLAVLGGAIVRDPSSGRRHNTALLLDPPARNGCATGRSTSPTRRATGSAPLRAGRPPARAGGRRRIRDRRAGVLGRQPAPGVQCARRDGGRGDPGAAGDPGGTVLRALAARAARRSMRRDQLRLGGVGEPSRHPSDIGRHHRRAVDGLRPVRRSTARDQGPGSRRHPGERRAGACPAAIPPAISMCAPTSTGPAGLARRRRMMWRVGARHRSGQPPRGRKAQGHKSAVPRAGDRYRRRMSTSISHS